MARAFSTAARARSVATARALSTKSASARGVTRLEHKNANPEAGSIDADILQAFALGALSFFHR